MVFGKSKLIGQPRKSGDVVNNKNKTYIQIATNPSTKWRTKNIRVSDICSLSTDTHKINNTIHEKPAPIDKIVFI